MYYGTLSSRQPLIRFPGVVDRLRLDNDNRVEMALAAYRTGNPHLAFG